MILPCKSIHFRWKSWFFIEKSWIRRKKQIMKSEECWWILTCFLIDLLATCRILMLIVGKKTIDFGMICDQIAGGVSICSFLFGVNGLRTRWFSSSLVFPGAHLASKEEEKTAKFLRISQKLRETISTNRDFFFWKSRTSANTFDEVLLKIWGLSGAKVSQSCRSRQELSHEQDPYSNEYLVDYLLVKN